MKMIRRGSAPSLVCAFTLLACGGSNSARSEAGARDSAGIRIVENPTTEGDTCFVGPTPTLDLGLVDGPSEYQFYRVFDAVTLSGGRIAVVDQGSGQIRIFSATGAFERSFGGEGGGPGEFRNAFGLWVMRGDTLVVVDYRPWRVSIFTPSTEFVRAIVLDPPYFENLNTIVPMADGTYLVADDESRSPEGEGEWTPVTQVVTHHDADGVLLDTLAALPYGRHGWLDREIGYVGRPLFEPTSRVAAAGHRVVVGLGLERELQVYETKPVEAADAASEGATLDLSRPAALIRWTGADRTVTREHIATYRRLERERYADADSQLRGVVDALLSDARPIADRFPAHASIMIGLEGDIWVHEYRRPFSDDPGWLVFDAEGRFECRAALPFTNVYEIGRNHVLGKEEDELEVEHIRRYALSRPQP